jgi:hypothetical protein
MGKAPVPCRHILVYRYLGWAAVAQTNGDRRPALVDRSSQSAPLKLPEIEKKQTKQRQYHPHWRCLLGATRQGKKIVQERLFTSTHYGLAGATDRASGLPTAICAGNDVFRPREPTRICITIQDQWACLPSRRPDTHTPFERCSCFPKHTPWVSRRRASRPYSRSCSGNCRDHSSMVGGTSGALILWSTETSGGRAAHARALWGGRGAAARVDTQLTAADLTMGRHAGWRREAQADAAGRA